MRTFESYDTLPLAIILTPDYIITVCLEDTPVISDLMKEHIVLFAPSRNTLLFQILYKSVTYYLKYLRQIDKLSDEIEARLRESTENREILRLLELQKHLLILMLLCVLMVQCLKTHAFAL